MEQNIKYPKGHMRNLEKEELDTYKKEVETLFSFEEEKKQKLLKNRQFAKWILISLDEHHLDNTTFSQMAQSITSFWCNGKITKEGRGEVDKILTLLLPQMISKRLVAQHGGYYRLSEKGREELQIYKKADNLFDILSTSSNKTYAFAMIESLAFDFYCPHNLSEKARHNDLPEEVENVYLEVYNRILGTSTGILIKTDSFNESESFYIDSEVYTHFKKATALKLLKPKEKTPY